MHRADKRRLRRSGGRRRAVAGPTRDHRDDLRRIIEAWPARPRSVTMFDSYAPDVSSGIVREALRGKVAAPGLLSSVERYSDSNWLYVSLT